MHEAVADAAEVAAATRQAENAVDLAHPGAAAQQRRLLIMAYAIDRAMGFAARDGAGSPVALAYAQIGQSIARSVNKDTMARVGHAVAAS